MVAYIFIILRRTDVNACPLGAVSVDVLPFIKPGREVARRIRSIALVKILTDQGQRVFTIEIGRVDGRRGLRLLRLLGKVEYFSVVIERGNGNSNRYSSGSFGNSAPSRSIGSSTPSRSIGSSNPSRSTGSSPAMRGGSRSSSSSPAVRGGSRSSGSSNSHGHFGGGRR